MNFCMNCGSKLDEGARFCAKCGKSVAVTAPASTSAPEPATAPILAPVKPASAPPPVAKPVPPPAQSAYTAPPPQYASPPQYAPTRPNAAPVYENREPQADMPLRKKSSNALCIVLAVLLMIQIAIVAAFGWPGFLVSKDVGGSISGHAPSAAQDETPVEKILGEYGRFTISLVEGNTISLSPMDWTLLYDPATRIATRTDNKEDGAYIRFGNYMGSPGFYLYEFAESKTGDFSIKD